MATAGKIRVLLALLCASLFFTSIIVKKTYTPANSLYQAARKLEDNLHKKESDVNDVINNRVKFNQLKNLQKNSGDALKFLQYFTTDRSTWFITTIDNRLSFWSGVKVIPQNPAAVKEGASFITEPNGYYEAIKKTEGNFSVLFFIPVKIKYEFQNQYLQNDFASELLKDNNIDIADFTDKNIYEVHAANNTYLFSVKLKPGGINHAFFYFQLTIWTLTLLCLCLLVQNICSYFAGKGHIIASLVLLGSFIVIMRFINLHFNWPDFTYRLDVFNPEFYTADVVFPSLGDFCINIFFLSWFAAFLYARRHQLVKNVPGTFVGYFVLTVGILVLVIISTAFLHLFYGLTVNSKINFDVNNVLNLSFFSMLGVLMVCLAFMIFYLLNEVLLTICMRIAIPDLNKSILFVIIIIITTAIYTYYKELTLFYILWAVVVFIRAISFKYNDGKLGALPFTIIILICACISSIKLTSFESAKEKKTRKAFIRKLEVPDDPTADVLFKNIERQIVNDTSTVSYFKDSLYNDDYLKTRLQKLYLNGYLTRYEFKVHEFGDHEQSLSADKNYKLSVFKDMVVFGSYKVSDYFYRENESFGVISYFAILPITRNDKSLGILVIELRSKPVQSTPSFPSLLIDGQAKYDSDYEGYSYAYYIDNNILSQSGSFSYDLTNTNLKGQLKKYIFKTTKGDSKNLWLNFSRYNHLIYKPSERNLIVVSKEENTVIFGITSITFFFVIFLGFSVFILSVRWLWLRIKILTINDDQLKWSFKINFDQLLYKTRIQFSMVFAVVITLMLVGFITFLSISNQYQAQQSKATRDMINKIAVAFENGPYNKYLTNINEKSQVDFNNFANDYATDLTLFDLNGVPLITTQPKIYEFGLQARRMNARAYLALNKFQKSEFVNDEIIGKLTYKATYVPLRSPGGETIAYLQLPYFSNEQVYKERIGSLLNIMINVYALIFIAIGLFAVIVARQITAPLSFIQFSLSKTIYGKKNEPISWNRNDEIGALVKEYNKMIAELENSAQKLAQSERESAWREMAKQVAHEIKNPLTPLKLGLQLLDKSWRDKDPKFDQKFERFSKSFVEQIESLSSIASEFSAFAKMPDTRIEQINVFEVLTQAIIIFKQMDNVKILYQAPETPFMINADRDQLLRCFNNLLKNAIEATPNDRMGVIDINYLITSKNILLTIKDNGQGIPEELREKIFEPNFTTKSSGTGLGLAFVKNSIENAGGKVWFETILGVGTTFYFSLPLA